MKKVSIVIPTRNNAPFMERCLKSIKKQTYSNIEIIVVDNNSDDGTAEIASEYATVLSFGPERSTQFNYGASKASGEYLYRIDGDFELEPPVVEACVKAIEKGGVDIVAVPNRSIGESYWAKVRGMERDTYLGDDLIVAARFWRKKDFESVGGFDQSLIACEDYDLHNRMVAAGFKLGRVEPGEKHLGEPDSLFAYVAKSFYYGPSVKKYLQKHPSRGLKQMFPIRKPFLRHWYSMIKKPQLFLGLITLKLIQYFVVSLAIILDVLGLLDERVRLDSKPTAGLILVISSLAALGKILPYYNENLSSTWAFLIVLLGLFLWYWIGRRRAIQIGETLNSVLPSVALAFTPYLVTFALRDNIDSEYWLFTFSIACAINSSWFVYLANPKDRIYRIAPWVVSLATLLFVSFFTLRVIGKVSSGDLNAGHIVIFDQALWNTANNPTSGPMLMSSIQGQSLLAQIPAPLLLLFVPLYNINLGSPLLLLICHNVVIGLIAIALYRLGARRIGNTAAVIIAITYLGYFTTLLLTERGFQVETFGAVALLFALDALDQKKQIVYFILITMAVVCGIETALVVTVLGFVLLVKDRNRWYGIVTLMIGIISAWLLVSVLVPFFGGSSSAQIANVVPPEGISWLGYIFQQITRPGSLNYVITLLAPLAFLSIGGGVWFLPALFGMFLNLLRGSSNPSGPSEALVSPFLFLAVIFFLTWLSRQVVDQRRHLLCITGAVMILVSSLLTTRFLDAGLISTLREKSISFVEQRGGEALKLIPNSASLATQTSLAISLAHRSEIYLLPKVENADFILIDFFTPIPGNGTSSNQTIIQQAINNPEYGIKTVVEGLLLFERGLAVPNDLENVALADAFEIDYPVFVVLADTVAYRGFSVSQKHDGSNQPFILDTYWESLSPIPRPYLIFSAFPGTQQFHEAVYGLYPVAEWKVGDLVRHQILVDFPQLPDGKDYELVAGLWYDVGEQVLSSSDQLLGEDIIRVATVSVNKDQYEIIPWSYGENE